MAVDDFDPRLPNTSLPGSAHVARARLGRSLAASALITGTTQPEALERYGAWLGISVMLHDVGVDEAAEAFAGAKAIFARNCATPVQFKLDLK